MCIYLCTFASWHVLYYIDSTLHTMPVHRIQYYPCNYVTCPLLRVYNCVYNCVGAFPGCKAKYWLSLFPQFIHSEVQAGNYSYCRSPWGIAHLLFTLHYGLLFTVAVPRGGGRGGVRPMHQTARRASRLTWGRAPVGAMLCLVSFPDHSFRKCAMFTASCSETS